MYLRDKCVAQCVITCGALYYNALFINYKRRYFTEGFSVQPRKFVIPIVGNPMKVELSMFLFTFSSRIKIVVTFFGLLGVRHFCFVDLKSNTVLLI